MKKWIVVSFTVLFIFISACSAPEDPGVVQELAANQESEIDNEAKQVEPGSEIKEPLQEDAPGPPPAAPSDQQPIEMVILEEGMGLNSPGPWMIFPSPMGLIAVSQDGREAASLGFPLNDRVVSWQAGQNGVIAMVKEDFDSLPGDGHKWLEIRAYPANELLFSLELLDYSGESLSFADEIEEIDFVQDRHRAVGQLAWSHDGEVLAFVSSHGGPSPDVYAYHMGSGEVLQLTRGPAHAIDLAWTPDDVYIFHAGVEKMYTGYSGAGYSGWTFYAASPDGEDVLDVYEGFEGIQQEFMVDWHSDREVLMASGQWYCGLFDLRLVDLESGKLTTIFKGQHNSDAYDPVNKKVLVWIVPDQFDTEECGPAGEAGLYLVNVPGGEVEKLDGYPEDLGITEVKWDKTGEVFLVDGGKTWLVVDPGGSVLDFPQQPIYSPDGKWVAYLDNEGDYFTVYDVEQDMPYEIVHAGKILQPTWSQDASGLFYFQEGEDDYDLYLMEMPGLTSTLVVENVVGRYGPAPIWLMP